MYTSCLKLLYMVITVQFWFLLYLLPKKNVARLKLDSMKLALQCTVCLQLARVIKEF